MNTHWLPVSDLELWGALVVGLLAWLLSPLMPSTSWWSAARRPLRVGGFLLLVYAMSIGVARLLGVITLPAGASTTVWRLALVIVGTHLLWEAADATLELVEKRLEKRFPSPEDHGRFATLMELSRWVARPLILMIGLGMALSVVNIDITPLVTGLGLAGLALSLGAQQLVQDIIAGIFILLEDQFHVGDSIAVAGVSGRVEGLSLRVTRIRDLNGTLHIVPNSRITVVSNRTAAWSRAVVDVGVSYQNDLDHVIRVLEAIADVVAAEDAEGTMFVERPTVLGPDSFDESSILFRLIARVHPGQQWEAQRLMRRRIKAAFDREGIEIPFPQLDVHLKGKGSARSQR
ncbi:MAG: mechanosensitive ion channel family protein [Ardenticatenia bacterium]|nr:mechanosensitive ion channel family protein [Ardenticatenia bacterium]